MKSVIIRNVLPLILLLIIGSCSSGPSGQTKHDQEMDEIDRVIAEIKSKETQLRYENSSWEQNRSAYLNALNELESGYQDRMKEEVEFLKKLSNEQLEIYSEYEESSKNKILSKSELCLRKLKDSLSEQQKAELLTIVNSTESLDKKRIELNRRQDELTEQKKKIVDEYQKNEQRRDRLFRYLSARINQPYVPSSAQSSLYVVQQSLNQWQQNIQRQQQQMQMYSINQSLRDIASALRGY